MKYIDSKVKSWSHSTEKVQHKGLLVSQNLLTRLASKCSRVESSDAQKLLIKHRNAACMSALYLGLRVLILKLPSWLRLILVYSSSS